MSHLAMKDMEEPYVCIAKWKKPTLKGYILYDSNCMMLWKKAKLL